MKRLILTALAATAMLSAEVVSFTPNGKTFHKSETCMSLKRAKKIYSAERAKAEAHKLKACGICYRPATKKAERNAWAEKGN